MDEQDIPTDTYLYERLWKTERYSNGGHYDFTAYLADKIWKAEGDPDGMSVSQAPPPTNDGNGNQIFYGSFQTNFGPPDDIYLDKNNKEIHRISNNNSDHYYRANKTQRSTLDVTDDLGDNLPMQNLFAIVDMPAIAELNEKLFNAQMEYDKIQMEYYRTHPAQGNLNSADPIFDLMGGGGVKAGLTGVSKMAMFFGARGGRGAKIVDGSFSISNWQGYPIGALKPTGTFRLLQGAEYTAARNLANRTNAAIHKANPGLKGLQVHEIHPVKFGGSPTDILNKIALSPTDHRVYNTFWMGIQNSIK